MDRQRESVDGESLSGRHHHNYEFYVNDGIPYNYDGAPNYNSATHHHHGPNDNDILIHHHPIHDDFGGYDHHHTETLYDPDHVYHGTVNYGPADHNHNDDADATEDGARRWRACGNGDCTLIAGHAGDCCHPQAGLR